MVKPHTKTYRTGAQMESALPLRTLPDHVPSQRFMEINVYALPGAEADFLAAWKAIQGSAPSSIVWSPCNGGHWVATRGREIEAIYKDHEGFSSRFVLVPRAWGEAYQVKPSTLDPPKHTGYRRILNAGLTSSDVEAARARIGALAVERIQALRPQGRCEFMSEFATHIPIAVFLALAELPAEDASKLPRYAEPILDQAGRVTDARIMDRFADYLRPLCRARMATPGRDLISRIVNGRVEGRPLTEDEAVDMATTMMTGGLDTIVSSLGLLMGFLAHSAAHRRRLAAHPERIGVAIGEMLRRFPTMTKARLCTRERNLDGVTIKPGDMIVLPPLHGLDQHIFDDPMDVDFDRPPRLNLTFGAGVHRCPGALLAKTELEIVISEWLARIPDFDIDPHAPPKTQSGVLGSIVRLGLTWPT
jgi:cytochrome P450